MARRKAFHRKIRRCECGFRKCLKYILQFLCWFVCISNLKHNQVKKLIMNRHSKPEFCVLIIMNWNYLITIVFSSNFIVFWMHNFCCQQQFSIMGIVSIISTWYICDHSFSEGSTLINEWMVNLKKLKFVWPSSQEKQAPPYSPAPAEFWQL